jgi:hypothetical protein
VSTFASLLRRADTLRRVEPDPTRAEWWSGYMRGLRRAHHGERFGTQAEHELWMAAAGSDDQQRAALGRGYRAGLTLESRDPEAYCERCEAFVQTIDDGETCAKCKLVL